MSATISQVLNQLEELSVEDKEYVKDTLEKWLNDEKREELYKMSEEALSDYQKGHSREGSAADLLRDLND